MFNFINIMKLNISYLMFNFINIMTLNISFKIAEMQNNIFQAILAHQRISTFYYSKDGTKQIERILMRYKYIENKETKNV